MDTAAELAELKNEVAILKEQMAELRRFLHLQHEPGKPEDASLHIDCSSIRLKDPKNPRSEHSTVGGFKVEKGGPVLYLWGNDSKARLLLDVKNNTPAFHLFHADLKPALVATLEKDTGCAFLAVFDHGKPRAVIKAAQDGGVISATDDEGLARVVMRAEGNHGEISVLNKDLHIVGQLTSRSKQGGGALLISTAEGDKAVTIATMPLSGLVAVHDVSGKLIGSLPPVLTPPHQGSERQN